MKSCEYDRVKHIDIAKGISICLVAMFHSKMKFYFPDIIEPMALFRMPLFFSYQEYFFHGGKMRLILFLPKPIHCLNHILQSLFLFSF